MGPLLRHHVTDSLVGIDLSAGMIAKARDRGCYDDLAVGELVEHLQQLKAGRQLWRFACMIHHVDHMDLCSCCLFSCCLCIMTVSFLCMVMDFRKLELSNFYS